MPTDACDLRIVGVNGNNGIELLRLSPTSVEELNGVDYDKESSHRSSPSSFEFQDIDYNQLSFDWQDIFNYLKRDKSEMAQTLGEALCATRADTDTDVDVKVRWKMQLIRRFYHFTLKIVFLFPFHRQVIGGM